MPDQWGNRTLEEIQAELPADNNATARWSSLANSPQYLMQMHARRRAQAIVRSEAYGPEYVEKTRDLLRQYPGASPEALVTGLQSDDKILADIFAIDADVSEKLRAERVATGGSGGDGVLGAGQCGLLPVLLAGDLHLLGAWHRLPPNGLALGLPVGRPRRGLPQAGEQAGQVLHALRGLLDGG